MIDERRLMELSACADGELDGAAAAALSKQIAADTALQALLQNIKRLDLAAASLPVPAVQARLENLWPPIRECSTAFPRELAIRLDQAAAALPVPEIPAKRFEHVWAGVVEELSPALPAGQAEAAPLVSPARWAGVWSSVQSRTSGRRDATVTQVDFRPRRRNLFVRGLFAAGLAASVLFSLLLTWPASVSDNNVMAMTVPEVLDERYSVHVRFVEGQSNPVVCFFLRDEEPGEGPPAGNWLPD